MRAILRRFSPAQQEINSLKETLVLLAARWMEDLRP